MLLKLLRNALGMVIVFISFITLPKRIKRHDSAQQAAQNKADNLSLYQFYACPFCVKTRRAIHALNIKIDYRDAANNQKFRQDLLENGGEIKVPCLRIEKDNKVEWLYESSDIIQYLNNEFKAEAV